MRTKILWGLFLCLILGVCGEIRAGWSEPVLLEELNNYAPGGSVAYRPSLSRDGLTIYFLRTDNNLWKFWQAQRNSTSEPFGNVRVLSELYKGKSLYSAWVSADGLRLYYSRHENSYTKAVIRQAERPSVTAPWTDIMAFWDIHGDLTYDYLASLTGDELTMFYTRIAGGKDRIYKATRSSINEQFSNRVSVSELNYDGHTFGPCVMPDGLTIYFSDLREGRGTNDIYVARRASTSEPFGDIELVGISTEQFTEQWVHVMPDEKTIYYYSNRGEEGAGIWVSRRVEPVELEIGGPAEVAENSMASYSATVHYDDGSTRDVTSEAVWTVEPEGIATIDAGVLQAGDVDTSQSITIRAQYSEGEDTVTTEKEVLICAICPSGSALQFDGIDDYVNLGKDSSLDMVETMSISLWIKPHGNGEVIQQFLSRGYWSHSTNNKNILLRYRYDTNDFLYRIRHDLNEKSLTVAADIGEWQHLVAIYDSGTMKLYKSGEHINEISGADLHADVSNYDLLIGTNVTHQHYFFNGILDEVMVFNRVLSEDEIRAIMHTKAVGDEPGLVGYWDFDEGQGQVAGDAGPFGNDGRLGSSTEEDESDPEWVVSDAPVGICNNVAVDIKPGSCPNPLNLRSNGVLPVAVLGGEEVDVNEIDPTSIRLAGVAAIRSSIEDVAQPVSDANECACSTEGPDGYEDLVLKFEAQEIAAELMRTSGELVKGGVYILPLSGTLFDGTAITGEDCVKLVGNVPKWIGASLSDINGDGVVNILDFGMMTQYWLEGW